MPTRSDRAHHAAMHPLHGLAVQSYRTLAAVLPDPDGGCLLVHEHGGTEPVSNLAALAARAAVKDGLSLITTSLNRLSDSSSLADGWARQTVQGIRHAENMASHTGGMFALTLRNGRYRAPLVEARVWQPLGLRLSDDPQAFLARLRALFDHCGVGPRATPGALGAALEARLWDYTRPDGSPRIESRPDASTRRLLLTHAIGARSDLPEQIPAPLAAAFEIDITMAYTALARRLPSGAAVSVPADSFTRRSLADLFAAYPATYLVYDITIPADARPPLAHLGAGPIPRRRADGMLTYPTQPGTTWRQALWTMEAEDALQAGYILSPRHGRVWRWLTERRTPWAHEMLRLRETAPTEEIAAAVKIMAVATIGRDGMAPVDYRVVDSDRADIAGDMPLFDGSGFTDWWLHPMPKPNSGSMTHWSSYTLAACRSMLYRRMVAEEASGNHVLGTNSDAIYLAHPSTLDLTTGARTLGTWRQKQLTQLCLPYKRAVIANEKIRLPGTRR